MQRFLLPAFVVCLFASALNTQAEKGTDRAAGKAGKNTNSKLPMSVTPEREAAALTFVKQHHPELAGLLVFLKKKMPKDYDKAARDLFRTSERLARLKDGGDDKRYRLELEFWQVRSRAQLLAARLKTRPDDKLESELRKLLERQYELRLSQLEYDRDRAEARLGKVNEQIKQFKQTRQQNIDRQIRLLAGRKDKPAKTKPTVTNRSPETTSKVLKKTSDE